MEFKSAEGSLSFVTQALRDWSKTYIIHRVWYSTSIASTGTYHNGIEVHRSVLVECELKPKEDGV